MDEIAGIVVGTRDRLTPGFRLKGLDMAKTISIILLFLCTTFVTWGQEPACKNEAPAIRPDQAQSISQMPLLLSGRAGSDDGRSLDDPQGVGNVVGPTASLTTLAAPEKASRAYEQAVREVRKKNGRLEKATRKNFLEISPEGPEAERVRLELAKWEKASPIKLAKPN